MPYPNHERFLSLFLVAQGDLRAFLGAIVRDRPLQKTISSRRSRSRFGKTSIAMMPHVPSGLARGIAAIKIKEDRRLRARNPQAFPPEVIDAVASGFDADEAAGGWHERETALRACPHQLPQNASKLITERYAQYKSIEAIASGFCLSAEAVYQALSRVRKQLRECIHKRLRLSGEHD